MFNPGLKIGQVLRNADIVDIFKCGNMGGMRRSKTTNTLVIVSDYTKGIYHDKWIGGVLHYTGMGKKGDQDINRAQNAILADCMHNGIDVHLFEVIDACEYIYCGRVELVDEPYIEIQPGEDGIPRKVWMFPVCPVPENNVKKPPMFVFKDMDDYKNRGKNVDEEYIKLLAAKKNGRIDTVSAASFGSKLESNVSSVIPADIVGKKVRHNLFGIGTIMSIAGAAIVVKFDKVGLKKMGYELCIQKNILQFI